MARFRCHQCRPLGQRSMPSRLVDHHHRIVVAPHDAGLADVIGDDPVAALALQLGFSCVRLDVGWSRRRSRPGQLRSGSDRRLADSVARMSGFSARRRSGGASLAVFFSLTAAAASSARQVGDGGRHQHGDVGAAGPRLCRPPASGRRCRTRRRVRTPAALARACGAGDQASPPRPAAPGPRRCSVALLLAAGAVGQHAHRIQRLLGRAKAVTRARFPSKGLMRLAAGQGAPDDRLEEISAGSGHAARPELAAGHRRLRRGLMRTVTPSRLQGREDVHLGGRVVPHAHVHSR